MAGARQVITVEVERVATSRGYGVPWMEFAPPRDRCRVRSCRKVEEGLAAYRKEKNRRSVDGLRTHLADDPPVPGDRENGEPED